MVECGQHKTVFVETLDRGSAEMINHMSKFK